MGAGRRSTPRDPSTVVLTAGLWEEMEDDLGRFLAAEADYNRLGMPYHRGYLLHGPPGTGKTSVAKAMSSRFGLDVYSLAVSALQDDATLGQLLANVPARSILLFEDVDVLRAATRRDDTAGGVTLSGFLNALDGFATPHGTVMVMTTNDATKLDAALVRPGRADMIRELGHLDGEQFGRLVRLLTGRAAPQRWTVPEATSAATVCEVVKRTIGDSEATWKALGAAYG